MENQETDRRNSSDGAAAIENDDEFQISIELDPDAANLNDENDADGFDAPLAPAEPPEIPSFVDDVRLEQITPEIHNRLRLSLDLPSVTGSLQNWEWLASTLGMPAEEITYIRERVRYPESPTLVVLRQYSRESFGRILRILRDNLRRYDVIIQLMPVLFAFEEHLRSANKSSTAGAAAAAAVPSKNDRPMSTMDSGIVGSSRMMQSGVSGMVSGAMAAPGPSSTTGDGQQSILITFAEENAQHRKLIAWLTKNLENVNVRVQLDETLAATAVDDWTSRVNECFAKARAIIVVCSPAYFCCVDPAAPGVLQERAAAARPMDETRTQCARFIYQLMCSEYRQLNCRNRRFRPIIFDSAPGGVEMVPPILRNTVWHQWPQQHKDLMLLIFGNVLG